MLLEELMKKEYANGKAEGKAEGVLKLLKMKGSVAEEIKNIIMCENDLAVLDRWFEQALTCQSIEEFARYL